MKKIFTSLAIIATFSVALAQSKANKSISNQLKESAQGLKRNSANSQSNSNINNRASQDKAFGFEASEGFTEGSLNFQNGWAVTETPTDYVLGQNITTDLPYQGTQSLVIAQDSRYPAMVDEDDNSLPIIGANFMKIDSGADNLSLYFQPVLDGATNFEFALISSDDYYIDVVSPYMIDDTFYLVDWEADPREGYGTWVETSVTFSEDTWYKLDIVRDVAARKVIYKMDDQVIYTRNNVAADNFNWQYLYLCHDNAGLATQMTIDNVIIGNATLGTKDAVKGSKLSVYPNPATSFINIQNNEGEKVESITIGDLTGKTLKYVDKNATKIDVQDLPKGVYLVKIKTDKGHKIEKIIKK